MKTDSQWEEGSTISSASDLQLALLQKAVSNLNDGVMITEADPLTEPGPRILFVNPAFERMSGYRAEEVLGRNPHFLHGPKTDRATCDRIRARLQQGLSVREEVLNYRKDGTEYWMEMQIAPLRDSSGTITHFVAVERDITERKLAQAALEHAKRQLEDAQELAGVGSWDWDVLSDTATWSAEMYRICGLPPGATPLKRLEFLSHVHPEDQAALQGLIDLALKSGERIESTFRLIRPDGEIRHIRGRGRAVLDQEGRPTRMVGSIQDITDSLEAEKARIHAERLEAANRELESFSYSVAHDLRAPARRINAYAHILTEENNVTGLNEESRICVKAISQCSDQMGHLIDDLLSLADVARGQPKRARCDLSEIARKVMQDLADQRAGREMEVRIEPGLIVEADERLATILLSNLLANALKFTRHTARAIIELGCHEAGREQVFYVRDNGVGFNPAYAHHLFKPFQRLHAANAFEGTGIGLATVQRITARHGGRVWAESAVDQGATFYFTFGIPSSRARA